MNVTHPGRLRTGAVLALLLSLLSATLVLATPANAATVRIYYNAYLGPSYYLASPSGQGPARIGGIDTWTVQQISDSPSGHDRVFLKQALVHGEPERCLDSHAATTGHAAWVINCNGGAYQIWEVFYQGNGSRVFKNWGSWTEQGLHLCLASNLTTHVNMSTCNVNNSRQQWYGSIAPGTD